MKMSESTINDMYSMLKNIKICDSQRRAKELKSLARLLSVNASTRDHFYQVKGVSRMLEYLLVNDKQTVNYALCVLAFSAYDHIGNQLELTTVHVFWLLRNILSQMESLIPSIRPLLLISNIVQGNKKGQTLVRESGCLKYLISMFHYMSQLLGRDAMENKKLMMTSWRTMCYCISTTVHTPINPENQSKVKQIIPEAVKLISHWIKDMSLKSFLAEFMDDLLSMLSYVIMANSTNQFHFAAASGIHITIRGLVMLEKWHNTSCELAMVLNKLIQLINVAIVDNVESCKLVGSLGGVSLLLRLLLRLNAELRLSPLVALGSLVESCNENKTAFLKENGLATVKFAMKDSRSQEDVKTLVHQLCEFVTQDSVNRSSQKHIPMNLCTGGETCHVNYQPINTIDVSGSTLQSQETGCNSQEEVTGISCNVPSETNSCTNNLNMEKIGEFLNFKIPLLPPKVIGETFSTYLAGRHKESTFLENPFKIKETSFSGRHKESTFLENPFKIKETSFSGRHKESTFLENPFKKKETSFSGRHKESTFLENPFKKKETSFSNTKRECSNTWFNHKPYSPSINEGWQSHKLQSQIEVENESASSLIRQQDKDNLLSKDSHTQSVDKMHSAGGIQSIVSNNVQIDCINNSHRLAKVYSRDRKNDLLKKYSRVKQNIPLDDSQNMSTPKLQYLSAQNKSTLKSTRLKIIFRRLHRNKLLDCKQNFTNEKFVQPNHYSRENIPCLTNNQMYTSQHVHHSNTNNIITHNKRDVNEKVPYSQEELRNLVAGVKQFGFDFKAICREYKFHRKRTPEDLYLKWTGSFISREQI